MVDQTSTEPIKWWSNLIPLIPWITVAIVLAITIRLDSSLDLPSLGIEKAPTLLRLTDLPGVSKSLLASVGWAIPALGFSLVALAAGFTSIFVAVISLKDLDTRSRVVSGTVIAVAAAALVASIELPGVDILSEPKVTEQLRSLTIRQSERVAVSVDKLFDQASYAVFVLLVSAASATLTWCRNMGQAALVLKRRLEGLQWVLYVGATALVLRAVENYMFYRWPDVWLSPEMAKPVDRTALAVSTAYGAFYTAVLIALYVPTALVIRVRATWLASQATAGTTENPEAWMTRMRLAASPFHELARLFLTLAPLFAGGPLAKLIDIYVS